MLEILPKHTGQKFNLIRKSFVAISPDSLDRMTRNDILYNIQLSGNEAFTANYETFAANEKTSVRSLNLDLVERLTIFELPDENVTATIKYHTSPRIRSLETRIKELRAKNQAEEAAATALALRIRTLETIRDETRDIYEEQRAVEELAKLKKKPVPVSKIAAQVQELRTQIAELQAADQIKFEEKVAAAQLKYQVSRSAKLELTGIATFVEFTPSSSENPS
jgi:inner membrane protein